MQSSDITKLCLLSKNDAYLVYMQWHSWPRAISLANLLKYSWNRLPFALSTCYSEIEPPKAVYLQ